jgi:hypothetical protein
MARSSGSATSPFFRSPIFSAMNTALAAKP